MSSTSNIESVILELKSSSSIHLQKELLITASDVLSWDLPLICRTETVKIEAHRSRLIQHSSYFEALFGGNFSESSLNHVSVQWELETVVILLQFIYGCPLQFTFDNFLPLLEGALFFGMASVLSECENWFSSSTSAMPFAYLQISLDDLICIYNFGEEHAIDFIPEICRGCLAQNFRWAMSCSFFASIPYNLLRSCTGHPHLTVDSEKQLCEALLVWLFENVGSLECFSDGLEVEYFEILRKVRLCLLPLEYAMGKRGKHYVSKLANESIKAIFDIMKDPYPTIQQAIVDDESDSFRIRLTQYSEKIDLSGCTQISGTLLYLSVLPSPYNLDPTSKKRIKQSLIKLGYQNLHKWLPPLSFESVREIDLSKCPFIDFDAVIEWLHKPFPSLRILKAAYCLHFKMTTLWHFMQKCPLVEEIDLTVDISTVLPTRVSILSENTETCRHSDETPYEMLKGISLATNLAKLTLEGRIDIKDVDLLNISTLSGSLFHLNIKGCVSLTDMGISKVLSKCVKLASIIVTDTYFGTDSVRALCSDFEHERPSTLAFRLQQLDIGGCKSVDKTSLLQLMRHMYLMKNLSLGETPLFDDALYNFMGSSLESLDICGTMVSGAALAHIIRRNAGLKILKASDCRNLSSDRTNHERVDFSLRTSSDQAESSGKELYYELSRICILDEMTFGWGFSPVSLEILRPAIGALRVLAVGLGASLGELAITKLPEICPLLESLILSFQVISDSIVRTLLESLKHLQALGFRYCFGELTSLSFHITMPNLRTLKLERVTPWMTNDDLFILTQNCTSLNQLLLSGCKLLDSDSQHIISIGWPGLTCIHLEDCGQLTSSGVTFLLNCKAIEDLSLRHNGQGIRRNFIIDAASNLPLLRKLALDLCDASEGGYDSPRFVDRFFLSAVRISCCKPQKCAFELQNSMIHKKHLHTETIVLEWNSKELRTTIVKERV